MTIRAFFLTAGVAALSATGVQAQETTAAADKAATATADGSTAPSFSYITLDDMMISDVIGMDVQDPEGNTIGDIDYIVSGDAGADAIIGIGGFLGLGEYTVALPLADFGLDPQQRVLTLDTDKETLKKLPEFDESNAESLPNDTPITDLLRAEDTGGSSDATTDPIAGNGLVGTGTGTQPATTDEGATKDGG